MKFTPRQYICSWFINECRVDSLVRLHSPSLNIGSSVERVWIINDALIT